MISRPVITDFHIKRALVKAQMFPPNSLEQNRAQSRALRLVEIKANEARFIQEYHRNSWPQVELKVLDS